MTTPMPTNPPSDDFRQQLFDAQQMTPALRDAYRRELDGIVHEVHTARSRSGAAILLVICIAAVIGEIWALFHYPGSTTFYVGAITMLLACAGAAAWIVRDFYRGRSVRKESFKMADLFYGAAGILTVVSLMHGLSRHHDPAATFDAFYVFVFLTVCAHWALGNRIAAAELSAREQALRLETRLADLAERFPR
jgi:peptidoglycan/LPS O-acetylase OafA/YrhL